MTTGSQKTDVNICGIHFDFLDNGVLSFQECEAKIDKRIQKYKHLPLTLHGKVVICNAIKFPLLFCENIHKRFFIHFYGAKGYLSQSLER